MAQTMPSQSAAKHARFVPAFHYLGGFLLICAIVALVRGILRDGFTSNNMIHLQMLALLAIVFWFARAFPLAVQDRLIRLEERLRLARLLPADLHHRIDEFTADQLISLRFASDAELPDLARKVLFDDVHDRKAIKAAIKEWRADHMRA